MRAPLGQLWICLWGFSLTTFVFLLWASYSQWNQKGVLRFGIRDQLNSHHQAQFSDFENPLGLNLREARLADRVRAMQDENQILKHQLEISQNQLMSVLSDENILTVEKVAFGRQLKEQNKKFSDQKESPFSNCEIIHICIVCAGINTTRATVTVIKSLLFHTRNPVHLHLVVDQVSQTILEVLFKTWSLPQVETSFYEYEWSLQQISWVPNRHYSGVFGLVKLTLPNLLPDSLRKVIILDSDVILRNDISKLWQLFQKMTSSQAIGLTENQSDWYLPGKLWKAHLPWPALGRGFNTGVMLMNLNKLRQLNWSQLWRVSAEMNLLTELKTSLADQDIINAVIRQDPSLVFTLPCVWNVQLSENTNSKSCYSNKSTQDLNLIHFNTPKKFAADSHFSQFFHDQFLTFVQLDGNRLKSHLYLCNTTREWPDARSNQVETRDECRQFREAGKRYYRTHIYYLDYDENLLRLQQTNDVTLAAHLSIDRLHMLEPLAREWPGPISLAFYVSDSEAFELLNYIQKSELLSGRKNLGYHIVYKEGDFYPINYLRNVALEHVQSDYVFLSDIDFIPSQDSYNAIRMSAMNLLSNDSTKDLPRLCLIVPAFETHDYDLKSLPKTKSELIHQLEEAKIFTFRQQVWPKGHAPTNYRKWKTATAPYQVAWQEDFEPYIVLRTDLVPKFDTRFVGFGWNKVSHLMKLNSDGFEFIVLPNVFMTHVTHGPSRDIMKFRSSKLYQRCLKLLKEEFQAESFTTEGF